MQPCLASLVDLHGLWQSFEPLSPGALGEHGTRQQQSLFCSRQVKQPLGDQPWMDRTLTIVLRLRLQEHWVLVRRLLLLVDEPPALLRLLDVLRAQLCRFCCLARCLCISTSVCTREYAASTAGSVGSVPVTSSALRIDARLPRYGRHSTGICRR